MAEKRDLLFLWINEGDDGFFKDQNNNFGSEYVFRVMLKDSTIELTAQKSEGFIPGFFSIGNTGIENVTAIVGKNGSGKTRLCRALSLFCQRGYCPGSYIAVIRLSDATGEPRYELRTSLLVGDELVISLPFAHKLNTNGLGRTIGDVVYYSPIIDFWNLDKTTSEPRYRDVSSNYLFYAEQRSSPRIQGSSLSLNPFDVAKSRDVEMHVALLNSPIGQEVLGVVGGLINGMPTFEVEFIDTVDESRFDRRVERNYSTLVSGLKDATNQEHVRLKEKLQIATSDSIRLEIQQQIFTNRVTHYFLRSFVYHLGNRIQREEPLIDIELNALSDGTYLEQLKQFLSAQDVVNVDPILSFFEQLPSLAEHATPEQIEWSGNRYLLSADAFVKFFKLYLPVKAELFDLNRYGSNETELQGFLRFDYTRSLSSGEKAYLDLFSRLFYARGMFEYMTNHHAVWPSNLYVILDEGEVGFHPAWQQDYVMHMVESLPKLFGNSTKGPLPHIHLIVATHSPISLSDIPREHVVVLQTEDQLKSDFTIQNQTFGANIHDLYRNSFFLENHTVGQFAFEKIDAVVQDLNRQQVGLERREEMLRIISMIGEPVIRQRLQQMYQERYGQSLTDEDRIQYHEEQLRRLRSGTHNEDH